MYTGSSLSNVLKRLWVPDSSGKQSASILTAFRLTFHIRKWTIGGRIGRRWTRGGTTLDEWGTTLDEGGRDDSPRPAPRRAAPFFNKRGLLFCAWVNPLIPFYRFSGLFGISSDVLFFRADPFFFKPPSADLLFPIVFSIFVATVATAGAPIDCTRTVVTHATTAAAKIEKKRTNGYVVFFGGG